MNALLYRPAAKGGVRLALPNINSDLRALPAAVDPNLLDPANAVTLDKDRSVRRPTDPQLYELRIEVLPTDFTAHPTLQAVLSGVSPQFVLLDASGKPMASTTLDLAAEFHKSTKLIPNIVQYFLEAQTFAASAQLPQPLPGFKVDFVDNGQPVGSPVVLPVFGSDLVILGDGETPSRLYIAEIDDNRPTVVDVKAGAAGVPVVTVPAPVCNGDTWLQDQFQLALAADDRAVVQSVVVHLPRMRSNSQLTGSPDNLAGFVDNYFPSANVGVLKDLWQTPIPAAIAGSGSGTQTVQLSLKDSAAVLSAMTPVARVWDQIEGAIAALTGRTPAVAPAEFYARRRGLAQKLQVLKSTPAPDAAQKRSKDALTLLLDQKLAAIDTAVPLTSAGLKLTIGGKLVELTAKDVNDLFTRLLDLHSSANYGGNLEVAPPGPSAPAGTLVTGLIADPDLRTLLTRISDPSTSPQSITQPWVEINTSWLSVGHIDEIACFLSAPAAGVGTPLVLRASPKVALALLDAAKAAQGRDVLVTRLFRGKKWRHEEDKTSVEPLDAPQTYKFLIFRYGKYDLKEFDTPPLGIPLGPSAYFDDRKYLFYLPGNAPPRDYAAHMSVTEVLDICRETNRTIDDVLLGGKGKNAQQSDYPLLSQLKPADFSQALGNGLDPLVAKSFSAATVVPLPVIFDRVESFSSSTTEALSPDLVNLQQLGRTLLVPRPYGPRMRPADVVALLQPIVDDNKVLGLPPAVRQAVLKLLTVPTLHARNLDVTTHWTSPSQSALIWDPASLNNRGYYDTVDKVEVMADVFRDGFDDFINPDRDYTKNDTFIDQKARDFVQAHLPAVIQRIRNTNPSVYSAIGYVSTNDWVKIVIPENTADLFEVYTHLVLEALGFSVKWVDSWFYHVHSGGVHCATNVLRTVSAAVVAQRATAAQKQQTP